MTNKNFSFSLESNGIHIDNDGQKFRVSYEETSGGWAVAKAWAQERGGDLGTVEQLRILAKHRNDINAELEKADREQLSGWYWTNEEYYHSDKYAYLVNMFNGGVFNISKSGGFNVRAVSAL